MSNKHYFVSQTGTVMVECPECGKNTMIPVDQFKGKKFTLKIKCTCGHVFPIILDFRKHKRKQTLLEGNYRKVDVVFVSPDAAKAGEIDDRATGDADRENCTIKNISVGGIGLEIWGPHSIKEGDRLLVEVRLDNKKKSILRREVEVRTVKESYVGTQFSDKVECHSDLSFYLWS